MDRTRVGVWVLGWALAAVALPAVVVADQCEDGEAALLISPRAPKAGDRVRVLAGSDAGPIGDLVVTDAAGKPVAAPIERLGGPPWGGVVTLAAPAPGEYEVRATRDGNVVGCATITVGGARTRSAGTSLTGWNRDSEALYALWIEHLFDAPPEAALSFDTLQEVLRDPERNLLHDHFGLGEDDPANALGAPPDCADMPYVLRAYFGWRTGLPLGFRQCSRGTAAKPPSCGPLKTAVPAGESRGWYAQTAATVMSAVHSGSARTGLADGDTDFYPVKLTRAALRPGTVYADPYGHTLMIVKWVPQTPERSGMLLAVDAQPDNSVARKRFWEGTFLFADDVRSAGPGFKAFRPVVANGGGPLAARSNAALVDDPRFAPFSLEQGTLTPDAFYARLGKLINPDGLRPPQAYAETLDALVEQLTTRVDSVQRGEDWVRANPGTPMVMPEGLAIFETIGPWEDFATPSRDLRLQIAMKVLLDLPQRLTRHPELYVLDGAPPAAARTAIEQEHDRLVQERSLTYVRSDGSEQRLTVADVLQRRGALEMGYNPNDCIEERWGAKPGSDEHATCRRHAPREQRARMESYREWFRQGRRPSR